ncbi:MAG TPA: helix-turn-helix transcriptional regulator [Solirubrobacterales bacterium]|jgi:transcriptional regulator with XRE-family HTH domain|nr:helix-turn-helix transcriptional regulator [Solirubrobacterales bacterium]
MIRPNNYSPRGLEAARLLGARIRLGRRERRWTMEELAERVGIGVVTMRKIEQGDPSVGLGPAFEAANLTGVALFHEDASRLSLEAARVEDRLAVLPRLVRKPTDVDDDF